MTFKHENNDKPRTNQLININIETFCEPNITMELQSTKSNKVNDSEDSYGTS